MSFDGTSLVIERCIWNTFDTNRGNQTPGHANAFEHFIVAQFKSCSYQYMFLDVLNVEHSIRSSDFCAYALRVAFPQDLKDHLDPENQKSQTASAQLQGVGLMRGD